MTRILAIAAISLGLSFSISCPTYSAERNLASDNGCFPWQDFRNGQCVTKEAPTSPPPLPEQPAAAPSPALAAPPAPPAPPLAPSPAVASPPSEIITRRPEIAVICDGGTIVNGACTCPSGFRLMPGSDNEAGGTCVRTNAENCLGGELTAGGKCLCSGQVTMSGEVYLLEFSRGKCIPMRCPVTELKDGNCTASPTLQSTDTEPKKRPVPRAEAEPRRRCGRGMVQTRSGCVAAHRYWGGFYRDFY